MPAIQIPGLVAAGTLALCVGAYADPSIAQQQPYAWSIAKPAQHATADTHPAGKQEFGYTGGVSKTPLAAGDADGIDAKADNGSDSNASSWLFDASDPVDYRDMHGCVDRQPASIPNTTTMVETGANAPAQARMPCHVPRIVRNVEVERHRWWPCPITKTHAEVPPLIGMAGQTCTLP